MRIRIRGPSGQSTVTIDDNATVESLRTEISASTGLSSFDINYGYPPKPLSLGAYDSDQKLSELNIKLNGEQLIISGNNSAPEEPINAASSSSQSVPGSMMSRPRPQTNTTPSKARQPREADAPLSLTRKQNAEMHDPPEVPVPDVGGTLVLRIMPDDNSCLFRAVANAAVSDIDAVTELRNIIAEAIQADPLTYNKAVLDNKDPDKYCRWIQGSDSWGGQVELLILSQYFNIEIFSIDVQSLRVDKYNEGAESRCFVVYSGIHYDTIALSVLGCGPEEDVKLFTPPVKDELLPKAIELCKKLQERHYYTDTAGFQIMCNDCGALVTGEAGATQHAKSTGHYNFGEAA